MADTARIVAVSGVKTAMVQDLFEKAVERWRELGVHVVGVVEQSHGLPGRTCSAGVLRDIVSGNPYSIYLEIPPRDTSCHIDAAGAADACARVLEQIKTCDLVVLSKFGKLEAARAGLFDAFEAAIAAGKPVLTSVSNKHLESWQRFARAAVFLPPDPEALSNWWTAVRTDDRPGAPSDRPAT